MHRTEYAQMIDNRIPVQKTVKSSSEGVYCNNASERRIRSNRLRRKRELRKNILLTVLAVCFAVTFAFSVNVIFSKAKTTDEAVFYKYYSSIVVESGDSLWSIAREHMGDQYENETAYVKEVMQMNSLTDETIIAGQHLVIPYYSAEFVN